jgi:dolichyl-diphosphooligosaccharide--protein glycosyltransferase
MVLASREEEAYEYAKEMDVDYMMVIFGGYARYSGDDINKFLWIIRIAGNENQHIKEADYLSNGVYKIDSGATKTMLNSMMYKMNYYRFAFKFPTKKIL